VQVRLHDRSDADARIATHRSQRGDAVRGLERAAFDLGFDEIGDARVAKILIGGHYASTSVSVAIHLT
jgi:hypothetical protein